MYVPKSLAIIQSSEFISFLLLFKAYGVVFILFLYPLEIAVTKLESRPPDNNMPTGTSATLILLMAKIKVMIYSHLFHHHYN